MSRVRLGVTATTRSNLQYFVLARPQVEGPWPGQHPSESLYSVSCQCQWRATSSRATALGRAYYHTQQNSAACASASRHWHWHWHQATVTVSGTHWWQARCQTHPSHHHCQCQWHWHDYPSTRMTPTRSPASALTRAGRLGLRLGVTPGGHLAVALPRWHRDCQCHSESASG